MSRNRSARVIVSLIVIATLTVSLVGGCRGTKFFERERLSDRSMQFDTDDSFVFIRNKTEAAREGAFGGYGAAAAGGCGCQ
ncbi:MAG: DUF4266 domain-containing protein [Planctomycetota bacterium]